MERQTSVEGQRTAKLPEAERTSHIEAPSDENVRLPGVLLVGNHSANDERYTRFLRSRAFRVNVTPYKRLPPRVGVAPDVALVDLEHVGEDGLQAVTTLRTTLPGIRIVILQGSDDAPQRLRALRCGADDVLAKPVVLDELAARIRAFLDPEGICSSVRCDDLVIDIANASVQRNGKPIKLTAIEFALLKTLLGTPGRIWSRRDLLERAWAHRKPATTRAVDVRLHQLRVKLGDHSRQPTLIGTVRGRGYRWIGHRGSP